MPLNKGLLVRDIERRVIAKPIRCRKLWLDAACNILRQAMLNIGPPTDGHAAVMYGGVDTSSRVSYCRESCAMLRGGPRAIRSTRVSAVVCFDSQVRFGLASNQLVVLGPFGPVSFHNCFA